MIRFRLKELMANWEYQNGEKLTLEKLADEVTIHRVTLSKIANIRGYSTTTDNVDKICEFFGCQVGDLMEHIPDKKSPDTQTVN
jgi:putative transcriptional regulator